MSNTFLPSHAGVTNTHAIHTHARAHAHTQTRTRYYSLSLSLCLLYSSPPSSFGFVLNSLLHYVDIFLDNPHTFRRALLHTPKSSTTRRKRQHSVETTPPPPPPPHGLRSNRAKRFGPFGESVVIEGGRPTQRMVSNDTNCDVIEATVRFCIIIIIIGMQRNDGTQQQQQQLFYDDDDDDFAGGGNERNSRRLFYLSFFRRPR